jgi:hypothetical protein
MLYEHFTAVMSFASMTPNDNPSQQSLPFQFPFNDGESSILSSAPGTVIPSAMSVDINSTHARWENAGLVQNQEIEEVCELLCALEQRSGGTSTLGDNFFPSLLLVVY